MSGAVETVLAELRGRGEVLPRGKGWRACCPAHSDTHPSLDIDVGAEGRVLLCCRSGGCSAAQVVAALGLEMGALFNGHGSKLSFDERITATYDYRDESGKLLFQAVRLWDAAKGKGFRQRRPDGKGGWIWKLEDTRRVLYRLPELLAADPGRTVYVVEGEKDADNLAKLGLIATTSPMGAGKWRKEFAEFLRGRRVVVLPDNDEPGRAHAAAVLASLQGAAASVRVLELQGLPVKGDVTDWLEDGGTAEKLEQMAACMPIRTALPLLFYDDIGPVLEAGDFLEGLLIDGAMSVIYGESGCGKTFFTLDLALHVAAGRRWFGRDVERRGVLYLALEGSHGIKNRVAAFKKANQIEGLDHAFAVVPVSVDLCDPAADTVRVIEAAMTAAGRLNVPVGLIVVDTLSRAMAGGNENSPEDMGALVRNLDLIRERNMAHVAVVHHSGKDGAKGARGHSLLRAATDTEVEVTREGDISIARVTKQRELEADGQLAFALERVELGTNRRGKPVTSCVVRETVVKVETRLPADQRQALAILQQVIEEQGVDTPYGRVADVAAWRATVYQRTKPGAKQDTKKRAFQRALDGLHENELIGVEDTNVWIRNR